MRCRFVCLTLLTPTLWLAPSCWGQEAQEHGSSGHAATRPARHAATRPATRPSGHSETGRGRRIVVIDDFRPSSMKSAYGTVSSVALKSDLTLVEKGALAHHSGGQEIDFRFDEKVWLVGYKTGIYDAQNLMPIARRGTTATPIQLDYNGRPVFLIDASVFPGSSGSPVLIVNQGSYTSKSDIIIGNRVLFLGVVAESHLQEESGRIELVSTPSPQIPTVRIQQMIDLGVVYKASLVTEAVVDFLNARNLL